ncbi:hypothetical protein EI94DRAFT_752254 [Lactarius quietus]|nr:hypothetical protein EI94DRAFT_752254 [Lactarius quietus]
MFSSGLSSSEMPRLTHALPTTPPITLVNSFTQHLSANWNVINLRRLMLFSWRLKQPIRDKDPQPSTNPSIFTHPIQLSTIPSLNTEDRPWVPCQVRRVRGFGRGQCTRSHRSSTRSYHVPPPMWLASRSWPCRHEQHTRSRTRRSRCSLSRCSELRGSTHHLFEALTEWTCNGHSFPCYCARMCNQGLSPLTFELADTLASPTPAFGHSLALQVAPYLGYSTGIRVPSRRAGCRSAVATSAHRLYSRCGRSLACDLHAPTCTPTLHLLARKAP